MQIRIVAVGQRITEWAQSAVSDYLSRFPRDFRVELREIRTEPRAGQTPARLMAAEAERILAATSRKKPHPLYASASFGHWNDGLCVQMLHVGPYDDEPVSFNMMQAYCAEHGLRRASDSHREIYLSDARKTDPARLKTVLRFGVEPCA